MKQFIALCYYMGLLKKDNIKHYWTLDKMMATPFARSIISRDDFTNIMKFFHLTVNTTYPKKDSELYDPRKKLGLLFTPLN